MARKSGGSMAHYALGVLRIVAAFTFCCHGAQKLFGAFGGMGGHGAKAHAVSLLWIAAVLEFFGGILIGVGLGTRIVAFILCGEMAVAYFRQHLPNGFFPIQNGGELAVLYCFIYLYLVAAGPGAFSLDGLRGRR
jgi:putative oxidoreductase